MPSVDFTVENIVFISISSIVLLSILLNICINMYIKDMNMQFYDSIHILEANGKSPLTKWTFVWVIVNLPVAIRWIHEYQLYHEWHTVTLMTPNGKKCLQKSATQQIATQLICIFDIIYIFCSASMYENANMLSTSLLNNISGHTLGRFSEIPQTLVSLHANIEESFHIS